MIYWAISAQASWESYLEIWSNLQERAPKSDSRSPLEIFQPKNRQIIFSFWGRCDENCFIFYFHWAPYWWTVFSPRSSSGCFSEQPAFNESQSHNLFESIEDLVLLGNRRLILRKISAKTFPPENSILRMTIYRHRPPSARPVRMRCGHNDWRKFKVPSQIVIFELIDSYWPNIVRLIMLEEIAFSYYLYCRFDLDGRGSYADYNQRLLSLRCGCAKSHFTFISSMSFTDGLESPANLQKATIQSW